MWAYRLIAPERFERIDTPTPEAAALNDGEVLVRMLAGGICGSDLPNFRGHRAIVATDTGGHAARVPGYPLHEIVGEVVASRDPRLEPGDHVVGWATGLNALAEFVVTPASSLHRLDGSLRAEHAVMLQPLACALYTIEQLGDVSGAHAAVLGLGPFGVLFSHVLAAHGAARVVGVDRVDRGAVAKDFGVDEFVHASTGRWAATLTDDERPDLIIEAIGHQVSTLGQAIDAVAFGGRIFYFGVPDDPIYPIPMNTFLRKNLTLKSGFAIDRPRVLAAAEQYVAAHPDLPPRYVTDVVPADDAQRAFELASTPTPGRLKVVLTMH